MTKYKCGHESDLLVLDSNPLTLSAYLEWSETVGINGDRTQCFDCWLEKKKSESKS